MNTQFKISTLSVLLISTQLALAEETTPPEPSLDDLWIQVEQNTLNLEATTLDSTSGINSLREQVDIINNNVNIINTNVNNNSAAIVDINSNIESMKTIFEQQILDLQTRVAALEAGGTGGEEPPPPEDPGAPCFTFSNTVEEDLIGNNWFDACVEQQPTASTIRIVLKDSSDQIVYDAQGPLGSTTWSYDTITDLTGTPTQIDYAQHALIQLDNSDQLFISGRYADDPTELNRCHNNHANGYGLVILPADITDPRPKLFAMSYKSVNGTTSPVKRSFVSWSPSHEISYSPAGFKPCYSGGTNGMIDDAFIGTIEVYIQ